MIQSFPAKRLLKIVLLIDLAVIAGAVVYFAMGGKALTGENSILTWVSALQLLAVALLCWLIFQIRNRDIESRFSLQNTRLIWGLIAAGFVFLFADETLKIHEGTDKLIHSIFSIEETGLTDRIDDFLILVYAILGLAVLFAYRREFLAIMRPHFWMLYWGFALLFVMVAFDVLTNRDDILINFMDADQAKVTGTWLSFVEEGSKILASGFFVGAFYAGWHDLVDQPGQDQSA